MYGGIRGEEKELALQVSGHCRGVLTVGCGGSEGDGGEDGHDLKAIGVEVGGMKGASTKDGVV